MFLLKQVLLHDVPGLMLNDKSKNTVFMFIKARTDHLMICRITERVECYIATEPCRILAINFSQGQNAKEVQKKAYLTIYD